MTASIIQPIALTDAMVVSSTAPAAVVTAWSSATNYADNALAGVTVGTLQTVYRSLQTDNENHAPASSPTWWEVHSLVYAAYSGATTYALNDIVTGPDHLLYKSLAGSNTGNALTNTSKWTPAGTDNFWGMFDRKIGTRTTVASPLTVVLTPGRMGGLALLELAGREASVTVKSATGGTTIYSATKSLDGSQVDSFYDWFFEDFEQLTSWVLTDLPTQYNNPEITISITATSSAASCGVAHMGLVYEFGITQAGATAGIVDYSRKTIDEYGAIDVEERAYSKRCTLSIVCERRDFAKNHRRLSTLRATPAIYIGATEDGYDPLTVYGFFRSFDIDVAYPAHDICALEIEGLSQ